MSDRYIKLSNVLFEAMMQTDFTKRQRKILDLIIRMSYGCQKKYALLRPTDFELVGVLRTHIKQELQKLVAANVLIIDGEKIRINNDPDQWLINKAKRFSQDKYTKVLRRNLEVTKTVTEYSFGYQNSNNSYQNSNSRVTKMVTEGYQNSNSGVTKMVTVTRREPSNTKGYSAPKDNIKTIKDIYIEEDEIAQPKEEVNSIFEKIENHYLQRRGIGLMLSATDCKAIQSVIEANIPLDDIIKGIDYAFDNYKPRHSRDRINSFRYCEKVIFDLFEKKKARLKAKERVGEQNEQHTTSYLGDNSTSRSSEWDWDQFVIS